MYYFESDGDILMNAYHLSENKINASFFMLKNYILL